MRLITVHALEFEEFYDVQVPPYAILSHRWGEKEISYKDYAKGRNQEWPGYHKILDFCRLVRERFSRRREDDSENEDSENEDSEIEDSEAEDNYETGARSISIRFAWIDTCCIDKESSAELSEAINSMFAWYKNAVVCLVYLADVDRAQLTGRGMPKAFETSEWFSRGWTLQELLAPWQLIFCDKAWHTIGHICGETPVTQYRHPHPDCLCITRALLCGPVLNVEAAFVTGIDILYFTGLLSVNGASIACRMSWAAKRKTTRLEDTAYCLLGIFDVNMPLLYGEGSKAFLRLQREIIRQSTDQSIFAHGEILGRSRGFSGGLLARSPADHLNSGDLRRDWSRVRARPYSITNAGLPMHVTPSERFEFGTPGTPGTRLECILFNLECGRYSADQGMTSQLVVARYKGSRGSWERYQFEESEVTRKYGWAHGMRKTKTGVEVLLYLEL
ncbi:hypothetical protein LTR85_011470 [Meristemomyces frigidus]|nr:hypothetical protein LTR85_011470 [Meristemomyces frigidus]